MPGPYSYTNPYGTDIGAASTTPNSTAPPGSFTNPYGAEIGAASTTPNSTAPPGSFTNPYGAEIGAESTTVPTIGLYQNVDANQGLLQKAGQTLAQGAANLVNPQLGNIASALLSAEDVRSQYNLLKFDRQQPGYGLGLNQTFKYTDFRSVRGNQTVGNRLDGAAAAIINLTTGDFSPESFIAAGYAAASAAPGGAYTLFNRETLYGWGNHGTTNRLNIDFTQPSQIATRYSPTNGMVAIPGLQAFEFRGDKINAVDYSKRSLKEVYRWKPKLGLFGDLGDTLGSVLDAADFTSDFIKFYFTGPKLAPGSSDDDDIIVFRATLTSLTDSFAAGWTSQQMIGRADPNYRYTSFGRSFQMSFTIYATDRDEMKPIWRKLNALASYTAPDYDGSNIALKGPWMRMTVGDIFVQQPVVITSVDYTLQSSETTWDINVERDGSMMQAPKMIEVSVGGNVISNYIPQKNGIMYPLAKRFNKKGKPIQGIDNWVSDFKDSVKKSADPVPGTSAVDQSGTGAVTPGGTGQTE